MLQEKTLQEMIAGANENNIFMQCDEPNRNAFRSLPVGFMTRFCKQNELEVWKFMWAQGDYMEFITHYFEKVYAPQGDEFFRRCTFVVDENDKPVATSGIWRSYGRINTILGFFVLPECEGQGVGRGLFSEVLKTADYPVYVHTHPTASRAIKLYSDFGFKLITDPVVGYRKNDLQESLPYLKETLPAKVFENLQMTEANHELLEAARLHEFSEF